MIDKNEIEGQLSGWVDRILGELQTFDIKIEAARSKRRLRELLKSDFSGLIFSMIHKFDNIPKNIFLRSNVFVMADDAYRSFGKDLGNYLLAALPDAAMIGFASIPIDKMPMVKARSIYSGKKMTKVIWINIQSKSQYEKID